MPGSWLWFAFQGEDCSMIWSPCAVRHLISHRLPRRQLSCVIFISIFYTPSIRKRDPGQSFTSFIVCLHSSCANCPLLSFPQFPPTRPADGQGVGCREELYMLLQRPISKTSTMRAAVLVGFPVWLVEEGSGTVYPHLPPVIGQVWCGVV